MDMPPGAPGAPLEDTLFREFAVRLRGKGRTTLR